MYRSCRFCRLILPCLLLLLLTVAISSCQQETPEAPETLPPHEHRFGGWKTMAYPTCTESGRTVRVCAECGESETMDIAPKGHTEELLAAVPPTCTENGFPERMHCSTCGALLTEQETVIPALGHSPSEFLTATEPTCTVDGLRYTECTVCAERITEEIIPASGHNYNEATCLTPSTCTVCKRTSGQPLYHTTAEGVCERCGESVSELFLYAATVYAEAGGENLLSKSAVAHTIHNRVGVKEWKKYPTVTAVILQPHQFSGYGNSMYRDAYAYYLSGEWANEIERKAMDECLLVCRAVLEGEEDPTGGATFFHSYAHPEDWIYHSAYTLLTVEGTEHFWFYR